MISFAEQKNQKEVFRNAQNRGVIAVIELGSFKVTCHILRIFTREAHQIKDGIEERLQRASYTIMGSGTNMSHGIQYGEITHLKEAERAIGRAVEKAQTDAQTTVHEAVIVSSGGDVKSYGCRGDLDLDGDEITDADIERLMSGLEVPDLGEGRVPILAQPVTYILDHVRFLQNPVGQFARQISTEVHMVSADQRAVETACSTLRNIGLAVAGFYPSGYASGLACLHEDEIEHGVVCVDIGAGTTGISIFYQGHLVYCGAEPIGGNNVRDDIAAALNVSKKDADQLKLRHGGVYATGADGHDILPIARLDGDLSADKITRHDLIFAMREQVLRIFEHVRDHLVHAGFDALPSKKIVLTGGLSQLTGIEDAARSLLGDNVRLGRPVCIRNAARAYEVPAGSAALGTCIAVGYPQDNIWDFAVPTEHRQGNVVSQLRGWLKKAW